MAKVYTRTAPLATVTNLAAIAGATAGNLANGTTYYYRVTAIVNTGGSNSRRSIPCAQVSAAANANGSIDLTWTAVPNAAYYQIWRSPFNNDFVPRTVASYYITRDQSPLFLHNRTVYHVYPYATNTNSYTDVGTESELVSTRSNYYSWDNVPLREWGCGYINISGGTVDDPVTFDDVYQESNTQGWGAVTKASNYGSGKNAINEYVVKDSLIFTGYVVDKRIILRLFAGLSSYSATLFQIGESAISDTAYKEPNMIIYHAPCFKSLELSSAYKNSKFYNVVFTRDEEFNANISDYGSYYQYYGVFNSYDDCYYERVMFGLTTDVRYRGKQTFKDVVINKARFGMTLSDDHSLSEFDKVTIMGVVTAIWMVCYTTTTLKNLTLIGMSSGINFYAAGGTDKTLTIINLDLQGSSVIVSSSNLTGGAVRSKVITKYEFDLKVLDGENNAVNGATVNITDGDGTLTTLTTNANGVITTQDLLEKQYSRSTETNGAFDVIDNYSAYTLEIHKAGYKTYKKKFTLDSKTDWTIALQRIAINIDMEVIA